MTKEQEKQLEFYPTRTIAFDNDVKGREAPAKIAERLRSKHKGTVASAFAPSAGAALLLLLSALVASAVHAMRAARVDVVQALRADGLTPKSWIVRRFK
jgi:Toprim-like